MRLIYNFFIHFYTFVIHALSLVNDKAKLWVKGRKDWKQKLKAIDFGNTQVLWFHCASLGEFEQGRPLIEAIKSKGTNKVLLTFFSPSGYELRKDYKEADWVFYLPADFPGNAQLFISIVKPKAVFFIKYEFWFNYLQVLKQRNVPVYLISGIFRKNQHFFKWYGSWFRKQLTTFEYFFLQNENSVELLNKIGYQNAVNTGDTRFDRVLQIMHQHKTYPIIEEFTQNSFTIVAGSTYVEDEMLLQHVLKKFQDSRQKVKLILAPHVVNEQRISEIQQLFTTNQTVRYSQYQNRNQNDQLMLIDNIGMLASLYSYATVAYIGGGLKNGIHNTLEAAVYGIPLVFGHNFHKFEEAKALVETQAAFVVNNKDELNMIIQKLFNEPDFRQNAGLKAGNYVSSNMGAVNKILSFLESKKIV